MGDVKKETVSTERLTLPSYTRLDPIGPRALQESEAGNVVYWSDYQRLMDDLIPYRDELMKIAEQVGEPDDPFAAWEVIATLSRKG